MPAHDHVWAYYQNRAPHVFEAAHARLDYLVREVARLAGPGRMSGSSRPAILNIGIGDGYLERQAAERGWSVHALDPSDESVAKLTGLGIDARTGRADELPFADRSFDCVVVSEVLEHLTDEERRRCLAEIARVLKPGGYLIGTVPYREILEDNLAVCPKCGEVFHRWGHTTSFDLAKVRGEMGRDFAEVRCRRTAFVQFHGRTLGGKLKGLARLMLAKCGATVAVPSILFEARRK